MSGEIGIIVQARMSSSRLPGKIMKCIGNHPLIFYVIERLSLLNLPVIVCTSTHPTDDILCEYLKMQKIDFFRGSLENVLNRYILAAEAFTVENIVRVTGDNPIVDISSLKDAINLFAKYDYVDGIYDDGLIKGTGFELVKLSELKKIPSYKKEHQEHVTLWLRENLNKSNRRIQLKPTRFNKHREDIFLTCDYPEDLELLKIVFEHFNYEAGMPVEEVVDFLKNNAALKNINKNLHHK